MNTTPARRFSTGFTSKRHQLVRALFVLAVLLLPALWHLTPAHAAGINWLFWDEARPASINAQFPNPTDAYNANYLAVTNTNVAAVTFNNRLYVFRTSTDKDHANTPLYICNDNNLSLQGSGWSSWNQIVPTITTDVAVAPVVFNKQLWVFARELGNSNSIKYTIGTSSSPSAGCAATITWTAWKVLPFAASVLDVSPAVVAPGDNHLYLYVVGTDDNIWYSRYDPTLPLDLVYQGWNDHGWLGVPYPKHNFAGQTLPGALHTIVAPAAAYFCRPDLYVCGINLFAVDEVDHTIYGTVLPTGAPLNEFHPWRAIAGGATYFAVSAAVFNSGLYVADLDINGLPHYATFLGTSGLGWSWSGWNLVPTGGSTNAAPTLINSVSTSYLVLFIKGGLDGRVYFNPGM